MRSAFVLSDALVALSFVAVLSACGSGEAGVGENSAPADPEAPPSEPAAPAVAPPPEEAPGATTTAAESAEAEPRAPAEACARAQSCCPAYVAAVPAAQRNEAGDACLALALATQLEGQPRDEACQGALEGFRASLTASGIAIPADCR